MLRVVLADHHPHALRALKTMLQEESGLKIIGTAADAQSLFALTDDATADVVLVDSKLPGSSIKELIIDLHALKPKPTVIVMSTKLEDGRLALQAGADAFVSKVDQPDWLLETLHHYRKQAKILSGSG